MDACSLGIRPKPRGGSAGAPPQTPLGLRPKPRSRGGLGAEPPAGFGSEPYRGSGGGAPSFILAANPPGVWGQSPQQAYVKLFWYWGGGRVLNNLLILGGGSSLPDFGKANKFHRRVAARNRPSAFPIHQTKTIIDQVRRLQRHLLSFAANECHTKKNGGSRLGWVLLGRVPIQSADVFDEQETTTSVGTRPENRACGISIDGCWVS